MIKTKEKQEFDCTYCSNTPEILGMIILAIEDESANLPWYIPCLPYFNAIENKPKFAVSAIGNLWI